MGVGPGAGGSLPHFRAHERRPVKLSVGIAAERPGAERHATVLNVSLAGAGLELEAPLVPGEKLALSFTTPTLWDPLVLRAVVTWSEDPAPRAELDALGRPRITARAGVAFDYADPASVLAMYELIASLAYD
jgi:PilZ domain